MVMALLSSMVMQAEDYPQTDADGKKIYYKIFSAAAENTGLCLTDNTQDVKGTYDYLFTPHQADNKLQEWEIIPAGTEGSYLLRNRTTYRYVSVQGNWVDAFYALSFSGKKSNNNALTFLPLGDRQVAMTYTTGTTVNYLCAGDAEAGPQIFSKKDLYDSPRAWLIYPVTDIPTDVAKQLGGRVRIAVEGRRIVVSGTRDYRIYDIQGRRMAEDRDLPQGIYTVEAEGESCNVMVR